MSGKRWSRADIWQWLIDGRPKKKDLPKIGEKHKGYPKRALVLLRCAVKDDRLIVGLYEYVDRTPAAVYYLTPSGSHCCRAAGENVWHDGKLAWVLAGGYSYWKASLSEGAVLSCTGDDFEDANAWMEKHFSNRFGLYKITSAGELLSNVGWMEYVSAQGKRDETLRRKKDSIDTWVRGIPALPDGLDAFVRGTVFGGRHYAMFKKGEDHALCSCCGANPEPKLTKGWKNMRAETCPSCGAQVIVRKGLQVREITEEDRLMVALPYVTRKGGDPCVLMVHGGVRMEYGVGERWRYDPRVIIQARTNGEPVRPSECLYAKPYGWSDTNPYSQHAYTEYAYPDFEGIKSTDCYVQGLEYAAKMGMRLNYNAIMRFGQDKPYIEYLIKGGYERLLYDMTESAYHAASLFMPGWSTASSPMQALTGLSGQGLRRLRDNKGGGRHLLWLRAAEMCGYKLSDEVWDWYAKYDISPTDIAFALNLGLSPEQARNYVIKQSGKDARKYKYLYNSVVHRWKDTISMSERLKADMGKDCIIRPRDLKARHDELSGIIAAEASKLQAEEQEKKYPGCKPGCDAVRTRFEFTNGEHLCLVPSGAADIIREGHLLGHCVGSTDRYFERIAIGESYIVFLRRASDPDKPWYTMEVEPGGRIRQLRTYGDNEGEERDEAKAFLREWQRVVRSRLTDEQKQAAETAAERYRRELDELIAAGSLIRNGKLAGKPLGAVLAADYNDLNHEEVAV